jgi:hypothetical protein
MMLLHATMRGRGAVGRAAAAGRPDAVWLAHPAATTAIADPPTTRVAILVSLPEPITDP